MTTTISQETRRAAPEVCMICGEHAATRSIETQDFAYRDGAHEVLVSAEVPIVHCGACDETYAADGAEEAQHAAVCRYLGRLAPADIRDLRRRLGFTQARLAELTSIGIASIKRWEGGVVIQNASLDAQLRALDAEAFSALVPRGRYRFHYEPEPDAIEASRRFELRIGSRTLLEAA